MATVSNTPSAIDWGKAARERLPLGPDGHRAAAYRQFECRHVRGPLSGAIADKERLHNYSFQIN